MPPEFMAVRGMRASVLEFVRTIPKGRVSGIRELASTRLIPTHLDADILVTLTSDELALTPLHRIVPPSARLAIAAFGHIPARE